VSRRRRPFVGSPTLGALLGLASFGLGWFFLWDAYDGRGADQPRLLRPFTWW
jgi:hypothetical protein